MVNPYLFIGLTIVFTVIGQLLVKAGMIEVGEFPGGLKIIPTYLWQSLINWKVLLGLVCAVLASFTWMLAMSKTSISFGYPFMALNIVLVLTLSPVIFGEQIKWNQYLGVIIVIIGLLLTTR